MKVLHWKNDPAAQNIVEHLKQIGLGDLTVESEKSLLYSEEPDVETDLFVVASTHKSETNKCSLTVHPTGNWGPAKVGGNEHELSFTNATALKIGLQGLQKTSLEGFEVSGEVTHHGPTNWKTPLIFIEIGSTEKEWVNESAGSAVAGAVADINDNQEEFDSYIGFGGLHYCPAFNRIILEGKVALGHIAPKYAISYLDEKIIQEAFDKSNAIGAIIDWKGLKSGERAKVIGILENLGIDWKKTKEF